jgi:lipopolysaccharide/colanic/teichoic acid biosynthesis glycosyltransferase
MAFVNKKESLFLFIGDLIIFYVSVWLALAFRELSFPMVGNFVLHLEPFSIMFILWVLFFYIAGLYQKHTLIFKRNLPAILLKTQVINIVFSIMFFYFIPYFSITPKTILFIYLVISSGLIYVWRVAIFAKLVKPKKEKALLVARGQESNELLHEVNNNGRYSFSFIHSINLDEQEVDQLDKYLISELENHQASLIVVDIHHPKIESILPTLYSLIFKKVEFIDFSDAYESVFDRVPVSVMGYKWFLENISLKNKFSYDFIKRVFDVIFSFILTVISIPFYPIIMFAIWIEIRVSPFIVQERIGKDNKIIRIFKFRTMTSNDNGVWVNDRDNRITKVGRILRVTRVDELPQLLNVLKGDISIVGPRPDIIGLFDNLSNNLPYYTIRNVVKPGLSGWAQTHQEVPPQSLEETKIRLSYDLYYVKNRDLILDVKIALQTFKTLISRTGK